MSTEPVKQGPNGDPEALAAAHRTIEVLKRKVVALYNGDQSSIQRQLELARHRDEAHRQRAAMMAVKAAEMERYSATLEAEVARRTEAIKTILNHVSFGFLVVGPDHRVEEEYTRSCHALLAADRVAARDLPDLLRLNERDQGTFSLSLDQVFEDLIPAEVTLAQMKTRFELDGRVLRVEGSAIKGAQGEVRGILFSIGDITALEAAQRENQDNRVLIQILRQKEAFRGFLVDVRALLDGAREALACGDQPTVRRAVHTIKGNAGAYELRALVDLAHELEEADRIEGRALDRLEQAVLRFLEEHRPVLGLDLARAAEECFEVNPQQLASLRALAAEAPAPHGPAVEDWTRQIARRPVQTLWGPIEAFVGRLASRLGKPVQLRLEGGETAVDVETMRPVLASMTHLIRNAIDHGLEAPGERGDKPATGRLRLAFSTTPTDWCIVVEDDGRGVNVDALVARAIAKGHIDRAAAQALGRREQLQLMFVDGISSATEATEISGRGVGMSSVLMAVRHAGGELEVSSEAGTGTRFLIRIPMPMPVARTAPSRALPQENSAGPNASAQAAD